jgi:hypothetical protein
MAKTSTILCPKHIECVQDVGLDYVPSHLVKGTSKTVGAWRFVIRHVHDHRTTTGSAPFADGPESSAKALLSSAKALLAACHVGRRQRAVGEEFVGKGIFADGHVSDRRQSFVDGHFSRRQRSHAGHQLTVVFADGQCGQLLAKYFFSFFIFILNKNGFVDGQASRRQS